MVGQLLSETLCNLQLELDAVKKKQYWYRIVLYRFIPWRHFNEHNHCEIIIY